MAPSFRLLFPGWALGLTKEVREANSKIWNGNEIFIVSADSPKATVVSFIFVDESVHCVKGNTPTLQVAALPTRRGKNLLVIAYEVPEEPIARLIETTVAEIDTKWGERLKKSHSGRTLGITVKGIAADGSGYLMALPLKVR